MSLRRISASSYSNTAPLVWSFLYGSRHGSVELIMDNAPARSAELLATGRVDAALVPVIAYHEMADARIVPGVCVGARNMVRSVSLITRGIELEDVGSVALDVSSRTSVVLTKIIFREFLGREPEWLPAEPDIDAMLAAADCALLIGDPALVLSEAGEAAIGSDPNSRAGELRSFDLAALWNGFTGLGFVFAMWMTRDEKCDLDFAGARDEGLRHIDEIVANYLPAIDVNPTAFRRYLSENIVYTIDDELERGLELYFKLAGSHGLCENARELRYTR